MGVIVCRECFIKRSQIGAFLDFSMTIDSLIKWCRSVLGMKKPSNAILFPGVVWASPSFEMVIHPPKSK